MAGYASLKEAFESERIAVIGASADARDKAEAFQKELGFPIAYGVTRDHAGKIGAWWEEQQGFIQPSEFILDGRGVVLSATYSTGPIGRLDAEDVLQMVRYMKSGT